MVILTGKVWAVKRALELLKHCDIANIPEFVKGCIFGLYGVVVRTK